MDQELIAVLAAAAQAIAAPDPAAPPAMLTPERPEIVLPRVLEGCAEAAASEIVVCGRREADARYRLPQGAGPPDLDAPRNILSWQISENIRGEVEPAQYQLPNGMVARGVVARVRIAF